MCQTLYPDDVAPVINRSYSMTIENLEEGPFRYRLEDESRPGQFVTIYPVVDAQRYMCRVWKSIATERAPTRTTAQTESLDAAMHWAMRELGHSEHEIDS